MDATITWDEVSSADSYNVYLKSNGDFIQHNTTPITETSYVFQDLSEGSYEAYVTSVQGSDESPPSAIYAFDIVGRVFPYYTDYSEETIDELPSDHTVKWGSGNATWSVVDTESIGGIGGKSLLCEGDANNIARAVVWNPSINWGDYVTRGAGIEVRVRTNAANGTRGGCGIRFTNSVAQAAFHNNGSNGVQVRRVSHDSGSYQSMINSGTEFSMNADEWYRIKLRRLHASMDGDYTWKAKMWREADGEPEEWTLEGTSVHGTLSEGFYLIGPWTGGIDTYIDEVKAVVWI